MIKLTLGVISSLFAFLPLSFLVYFKFRLGKKFLPLSIYVILAAFAEVLLLTAKGNNLHFTNSFAILSFLLLGWMYSKLINNQKIRLGIALSSFILFGLGILNMVYLQGLSFVNSYTFMVQVVFVSMLSSILIFQCYSNLKVDQNPLKEPKLITAMAFLFYYGTCFFIFAYAFEAMRFNSGFPIRIWNIHSVVNIIFNIFLTYLICIAATTSRIHE